MRKSVKISLIISLIVIGQVSSVQAGILENIKDVGKSIIDEFNNSIDFFHDPIGHIISKSGGLVTETISSNDENNEKEPLSEEDQKLQDDLTEFMNGIAQSDKIKVDLNNMENPVNTDEYVKDTIKDKVID